MKSFESDINFIFWIDFTNKKIKLKMMLVSGLKIVEKGSP